MVSSRYLLLLLLASVTICSSENKSVFLLFETIQSEEIYFTAVKSEDVSRECKGTACKLAKLRGLHRFGTRDCSCFSRVLSRLNFARRKWDSQATVALKPRSQNGEVLFLFPLNKTISTLRHSTVILSELKRQNDRKFLYNNIL